MLSRPKMNVPEAMEALRGICVRHPEIQLSEPLLQCLTELLDDTSATVRGKILLLLPEEQQQNFLEATRLQLREKTDPELLAVHLEILRDRGDQVDIEMLEEIAAEIDDEDMLEVISETIVNMRKRMEDNAWS